MALSVIPCASPSARLSHKHAQEADGKRKPIVYASAVAITEPLFILAPMRSYSTVAAAMLGQHPQMYSTLETHLFSCDTMAQWWVVYRTEGIQPLAHGLLRAIAELIMGGQSEATIALARLWVLCRLAWPTTEVFRVLAREVDPAILIDKSPTVVNRLEHLQRVHAAFPRARFLHLTRHPLGFGRSFLKFFEEFGVKVMTDPQILWHRQHSNILYFLATLSPAQHLRVRGEDLLANPNQYLAEISDWLGVRSDRDAIDRMMHPERSPFASLGPPNALFGGDPHFFRDPRLHRLKAEAPKLDGPLPWRGDGAGFTPAVRDLARQFGYV
jgi:hypothetical protein